MKLSIACVILLTIPFVSSASTLTFEELGTTPAVDVNGLHTQGVLFSFTPGQAAYNGTIGTAGNAVLSIDPVLMGPSSGTLTLVFDLPTPLLQFDVVLQSLFPLDDSNSGANGGPAYTVLLSSGATLNGSTAPQPGGFYSEGHFQYNGAAITSAEITFYHGFDAGGSPVRAFGLDNLTFASEGVPEPAPTMLIAAGLIAIGTLKRYASNPL